MPHPGAGRLVQEISRLGSIGWAGVDVFFNLSGFLIGGLLLDNRRSPNLLRVFYARRTLRIFPIYYVWFALFVILLKVIKLHSEFLLGNPLPLWSYATYTQNLVIAYRADWSSHWMNMSWSLAVEEQFYLLLPWIILWCPPRHRMPAFAALIGGSFALRVYLDAHGHGMAGLVLLPAHWDSLFFGVLGAELLHRPRFISAMQRHSALLLHGPLLLLIGFFFLWIYYPRIWDTVLPGSGRSEAIGLISLWLIFAAVLSPYRAPLRARWLRGLGIISYGVYIFHQGINGLVHYLAHGGYPSVATHTDLALTLLSLALTLGLAALSYRYFEVPLLRLGHYFRYARPPCEPELPITPPGLAGPPVAPVG